MIEDAEREALYEDYTATMQKHLVSILAARYGLDLQLPSWLEMVHPKDAPPVRSVEDDRQHVHDLFGI
jgi:hypothetical protein